MDKAIVIDVETTGKNIAEDRVVELCVMDRGTEEAWVVRFNPEIPIPPEAQAIHGISSQDVSGCPKFVDLWDEVYEALDAAAVWIGYNIDFDINMLDAEFSRIGHSIPALGKHIVDPYKLWRRMERRDLSSAHRKFCGKEIEGAHGAKADALATFRVLEGMQYHWRSEGIASLSWSELAKLCDPRRPLYVGATHHFLWDGDVAVFGFGAHEGKPILEFERYLEWMQTKDFPQSVQSVVSAALAGELKR